MLSIPGNVGMSIQATAVEHRLCVPHRSSMAAAVFTPEHHTFPIAASPGSPFIQHH